MARAPLDLAEVVAAPRTGVVLGAGASGPVSLRLFRPSGTRIVAAAGLLPAQLLVMRAAVSAIPVEIRTARVAAWEPVLQLAPGSLPRSCGEAFDTAPGPRLLVDDCPASASAGATPGAVRAWQCRVEVRTGSTAADLRAFAAASLAIFAALPQPLAARVGAAFELPMEAVQMLTGLDARSVGLVRRGRIDVVTLEPTPAERRAFGIEPMRPNRSDAGSG